MSLDFEKVFSTAEHLYHRTDIDNMSVCGEGSQLSMTENVRKELVPFLKKWNAKSVLDAPCGDCFGMRYVDFEDISYTGGEVQTPQVKKLKENFPDKNFVRLDVANDELPEVDIWFCRDCLFHFSNEDKLKTLRNFVSSNIKYILMSNHCGWTLEEAAKFKAKMNESPRTGGFSHVNWKYAPWNFEEPLDRFYDNYEGHNKKEMVLYTREQIKRFLDGEEN